MDNIEKQGNLNIDALQTAIQITRESGARAALNHFTKAWYDLRKQSGRGNAASLASLQYAATFLDSIVGQNITSESAIKQLKDAIRATESLKNSLRNML